MVVLDGSLDLAVAAPDVTAFAYVLPFSLYTFTSYTLHHFYPPIMALLFIKQKFFPEKKKNCSPTGFRASPFNSTSFPLGILY